MLALSVTCSVQGRDVSAAFLRGATGQGSGGSPGDVAKRLGLAVRNPQASGFRGANRTATYFERGRPTVNLKEAVHHQAVELFIGLLKQYFDHCFDLFHSRCQPCPLENGLGLETGVLAGALWQEQGCACARLPVGVRGGIDFAVCFV